MNARAGMSGDLPVGERVEIAARAVEGIDQLTVHLLGHWSQAEGSEAVLRAMLSRILQLSSAAISAINDSVETTESINARAFGGEA